jgi:hypothetical protein
MLCRMVSTAMEHGTTVTLCDLPVSQANQEAKADKPYHKPLGGLEYLTYSLHPDIWYATSCLATVLVPRHALDTCVYAVIHPLDAWLTPHT